MSRANKLMSCTIHLAVLIATLNAPTWMHAQCPGVRPQFSWSSNDSSIVFFDQTELTTEVYNRVWYFGDGASSNSANPTHVYDTAGVSLVSLTFETVACSYSISAAVVHAGVNDDCSSQLSSDFLYDPLGNNHLSFTDASVADGSFVLHLWSFGDDSTSFAESPEHFYIYPGTYDVAHSIGTVDSLFQTACVAGHVERIFVNGNTSTCDSSLFLDLTIGEGLNPAPLDAQAVLFNDDLTILGWVWDFGDSTQSIGTASEHYYIYDGEYQVCVRVDATDPLTSDTCFALACSSYQMAAVAVADHAGPADLRVWPVPFTDEIHIAGDAVRRGRSWRMLDAMGSLVDSGTISHDEQELITAPQLPPGMYVLRVDGAMSFALRLIKQ